MVLEKLGDSLKNTLSKITKSVFVDEKLINELVKDIQRALLQSDTNVQLVFDLSKKIKERAKEKTPPGITKREQLINIVYEELTNFLGKETHEIKISKKPTLEIFFFIFPKRLSGFLLDNMCPCVENASNIESDMFK